MSFSYFAPGEEFTSPANRVIKTAKADDNKIQVSFINGIDGEHFNSTYLKATRSIQPSDEITVYFDIDIVEQKYFEIALSPYVNMGTYTNCEGDNITKYGVPMVIFSLSTYDGILYTGLNSYGVGGDEEVSATSGVQKYVVQLRVGSHESTPFLEAHLFMWLNGEWTLLLENHVQLDEYEEWDGIDNLRHLDTLYVGSWQWFNNNAPVGDMRAELVTSPANLLTFNGDECHPLQIVEDSVSRMEVDYFTDYSGETPLNVNKDGFSIEGGLSHSYYTRPMRKDLWKNGYDFGVYTELNVPENFAGIYQHYSPTIAVGSPYRTEVIGARKWTLDLTYDYFDGDVTAISTFNYASVEGLYGGSVQLFNIVVADPVIVEAGDLMVGHFIVNTTKIAATLYIKRGEQLIKVATGEKLWSEYLGSLTPTSDDYNNAVHTRNNLEYKGFKKPMTTEQQSSYRDEMQMMVIMYASLYA